VVDWIDFRNQSQTDLKATNLLYEAGDYGNAAYHLQQAVEKHTKCILLAGGLMPKRRTHLPLTEFLEEFITGINNFGDLSKRHKIYFLDTEEARGMREQFLNQSRIIMEGLAEKKPSFRNALWKNSLGIPLVDNQEEAVFQQCPLFLRHTGLKIDMTRGWVNDSDLSNFDNDPIIKRMFFYKTPVELGPTIAATFTHAEVGRYPTDINTREGVKNSVDLYREQKNELRKLIDSVTHTLSIS
jgi:HEPN domain-containing protein